MSRIAGSLAQAENPLIITGYSGRNHLNPSELVKLVDTIPGLRVFDTMGSDMCFPFSHPGSVGFRFSSDICTTEADVILVLDCDVPWIPARNPPRKDARIFHVDVDPLNSMIQNSFFPAHGRWRADNHTALTQINTYLKDTPYFQTRLESPEYIKRRQRVKEKHSARLNAIKALAQSTPNQTLNIH